MVNYSKQMQYDLRVLEMLIQAADNPDWKEDNVKRAKDGKFATKSGGSAADVEPAKKEESLIDRAKNAVTEKISSAKIQEHFDGMMTSLKADLGKIQDAGAGKLNEIAQDPKVREMRKMASDAAARMGAGAKDAYNKVSTAINNGLTELDKRIPQSVKTDIGEKANAGKAFTSEKGEQMKKFADNVMKSTQDAIEVAKDPQIAAAGATLATGMLVGIAASAAGALGAAVTGGTVSLPILFGVSIGLTSGIHDNLISETIKKFQVGMADKKAARDVNKIMDDLSAQLKSVAKTDEATPSTKTPAPATPPTKTPATVTKPLGKISKHRRMLT